MTPLEKKRVLKKIRKDYIRKRYQDGELTQVDPTTKLLGESQNFTLKPANCLVLVNRKIMMGLQYLNHQFHINQQQFDNPFNPKSVTLSLKSDENVGNIPWQYAVKRLESYGDLNLAVWASQITKYYTHYPKLINNYFKMLNAGCDEVILDLEKAKERARLAKEEIESRCAYRKLTVFANKDACNLLSTTYNDQFLKETGHTIQSFSEFTKDHGLPAFFEGDCSTHHFLAKKFLGGYNFDEGPVKKEAEYLTTLIDKDGNKRKVFAHHITIMEPSEDGIILSGYFLINKEKIVMEENQSRVLEKYPLAGLKRWKKEEDLEVIHPDEFDKMQMMEEKRMFASKIN